MNKSLTIIGIILCLSNVVYSFFGVSETGQVFGMEMNIWIYRIIWTVFAAGIFYEYFKKYKSKKNSS